MWTSDGRIGWQSRSEVDLQLICSEHFSEEEEANLNDWIFKWNHKNIASIRLSSIFEYQTISVNSKAVFELKLSIWTREAVRDAVTALQLAIILWTSDNQ